MSEASYRKIDVETGEATLLHPDHPFVQESKEFDAVHGNVYGKCRECGGTIRVNKDNQLFDHFLLGNYKCKGSGLHLSDHMEDKKDTQGSVET